VINVYADLAASQCPFCFYLAPLDGVQIIGNCPNCGKDTRPVIFSIRCRVRSFFLSLFPWVKVNLIHRDEFPT